jgi:hypothetical protein
MNTPTPHRRLPRAPRPPHPGRPRHRAPLARQAVSAGYRAHLDTHHGGHLGRDCRTCARYLVGIADAAEHVTISACRGTAADPDPQAGTDPNTAPNATSTWPPSDAQALGSAPNASASTAADSSHPT